MTVRDGSPGSYGLYLVGGDSTAIFVNGTIDFGLETYTDVIAFDPAPSTHLVASDGRVLEIAPPGCVTGGNPGCFVQDGVLGTLPGAHVFVGLDVTAA